MAFAKEAVALSCADWDGWAREKKSMEERMVMGRGKSRSQRRPHLYLGARLPDVIPSQSPSPSSPFQPFLSLLSPCLLFLSSLSSFVPLTSPPLPPPTLVAQRLLRPNTPFPPRLLKPVGTPACRLPSLLHVLIYARMGTTLTVLQRLAQQCARRAPCGRRPPITQSLHNLELPAFAFHRILRPSILRFTRVFRQSAIVFYAEAGHVACPYQPLAVALFLAILFYSGPSRLDPKNTRKCFFTLFLDTTATGNHRGQESPPTPQAPPCLASLPASFPVKSSSAPDVMPPRTLSRLDRRIRASRALPGGATAFTGKPSSDSHLRPPRHTGAVIFIVHFTIPSFSNQYISRVDVTRPPDVHAQPCRYGKPYSLRVQLTRPSASASCGRAPAHTSSRLFCPSHLPRIQLVHHTAERKVTKHAYSFSARAIRWTVISADAVVACREPRVAASSLAARFHLPTSSSTLGHEYGSQPL
ncbi:hypothetical protein EVG20_g10810 [Dentipellis fragilis]|uniref:Uncharacterized protein n=1 Tax=Dentipellis fragilis TaxID=205917 RepID=A0A4Y9XRP1_9AGAM|nr:hypothetical protein EVG20_g10810 [Dentipellis fragilis]